MDESQDMKVADVLAEDTTSAVEEDDIIHTLPHGAMLGGEHGKVKVAVMRRNVAGRKKPTRQGLRDSLLKSLDETDLQNLLADVSLEEEDETDSSKRQHADSASGHADPTPTPTESSRNPLLADLNKDLSGVLRRRQSAKGESSKGAEATERRRVRPVTMPAMSAEDKESTAEWTAMRHDSTPHLPPIDLTTEPKVLNAPKPTPPSQPPILVPRADRMHHSNHTDMVTSPEHLQPKIMSSGDRNVELSPLAVKLRRVHNKHNAPDKTDDANHVPWTSKLRKVELPTPHSQENEKHPPILPPKPKLRPKPKLHPVSLIPPSVAEQGVDNSNEIEIEQQSVSLSSLPSKTLKSPVDESSVRKQPTSSLESTSQPVPDISRARSLKSTGEPPVMRRPQATTNSQPDWIQQAAEKRRRASMLLEQGTLSRTSSMDSNSTTSSQQGDAPVPRWKRELNQQNAQRRVDRQRKVQSCIEQTTPDIDTGKENRGDNSTPAWKKQLKPSKVSVETRSDEKVVAEPEFIRKYKKRQDRLRKCDSLLLEME